MGPWGTPKERLEWTTRDRFPNFMSMKQAHFTRNGGRVGEASILFF